MNDQKIHHARIMIECGCALEDVAVTLGMKLDDAIYAVAPSLHANPTEQKRVRQIAAGRKINAAPIPVIHRAEDSGDIVYLRPVRARAAA